MEDSPPKIAPSNSDLFQSMTHCLGDQNIRSYEEAKNRVDSSIASKAKQFFRLEIYMLAERWGEIVAGDV